MQLFSLYLAIIRVNDGKLLAMAKMSAQHPFYKWYGKLHVSLSSLVSFVFDGPLK
jgi:hypothetical protein